MTTIKTNEDLIRDWFAEYADFGEVVPTQIVPIKSSHKFGKAYRLTFPDGRVEDWHASFLKDGTVEMEGI